MVYLVNNTTTNIDIQRGRIVIPPLGWKEVDDSLADHDDVVYARENEWITVSKKKPTTPEEGVPPFIADFADPNKGIDKTAVRGMVANSREKYRPAGYSLPDEAVKETVDSEDVPVHKSSVPEEISAEDVKAALGKADVKEEASKTPRKKKTEAADLGEFS